MPLNIDNYDFVCPAKNGARQNAVASDLHIDRTHASVEVIGIDGVSPSSPTSPHGVGIDNQGRIDITGLNVQPGATLRLRLKHTRDNARFRQLKYVWTYPAETNGNRQPQTLAAYVGEEPPEEDSPSEAAVADLKPILEALLQAIEPVELSARKRKDG